MNYNTSLRSVPRGHRSEPVPNDGPRLVEPGESLPLKFQIDRMMDAGVKRQVWAAQQRLYHFGPNGTIPEVFIDPTQDFNCNIATIHQLKNYLEAKVRQNQEAAAAAEAEAQAIVDAEKPPETPPEVPEE